MALSATRHSAGKVGLAAVVKVSNGTGNESESIVQYINSASDWLDPFPEILESLEAIADHQKTWFVINEEGHAKAFVTKPSLGDPRYVYVTAYSVFRDIYTEAEARELGEVRFQGALLAKRFVQAFYEEMRRFSSSDEYNPMEWSGRPMWALLDLNPTYQLADEQLLDKTLMKRTLEVWRDAETDVHGGLLMDCLDEVERGRSGMKFKDVFLEFGEKLVALPPLCPWDDATRVAIMRILLDDTGDSWDASDLRSVGSLKIEAWLANET